MSLRRRIALICAAAAAVAVVLASVLTYVLTSHQLHGQVDSQLRARAGDVRFLQERFIGLVAGAPPAGPLLKLAPAGGKSPAELRVLRDLDRLTPAERRQLGVNEGPFGFVARSAALANGSKPPANLFGSLPPKPNQVRGYQQLVNRSGAIVERSNGGVALPVDSRTRAVAAGTGKSFLESVHVHGLHLRVLVAPAPTLGAVQFAQSLGDVDHLLGKLRLILGLLSLGAIALAALLARIVAGAALVPVKRLTETAEHVTHTQDLSRRIEPAGPDEIGRLAASFNAMLDALEGSMKALDASATAQRQLVADASHELRTPVTSMRTNIEFLQQAGDMDEVERRRVLGDLVEQVEELTALMNDLIELARGDERREHDEDVRLDVLVEEAVARAQRRIPERPFELRLDETVVAGWPDRLGRAVNNLVDNAVKYSPAASPVEIALHDGELSVRDHGPGIPEQDLAHVFDRFYRGADARGRPGSGLGLAIVRQVAASHGGSVSAERPPGGGTVVRLRLPAVSPDAAERAVAPGERVLTRTLRTRA